MLVVSRALSAALLLPGAPPSRASAPIRCSAFFDTECRLTRTTGPTGGEVDRFVPVHGGKLLTRPAEGTDARLEPVLLDSEAAAPFLAQDGSIQAWLGTATEGPLAKYGINDDEGEQPPGFWLLELSHLPEPPSILDGTSWTPLRAAGGPGGGASAILDSDVGLSSDDEVALLSVARGLGLWHRSVPFCAVSGGPTVPVRHGRNAQSGESGTRHRPRTDPSVIMLVLDRSRSRCLLGRQARWPAGRYSTLAGFVEFGESLEECVVREVKEESGVLCDRASLQFVASQPWSFPRSLMVGFTVEVDDDGGIPTSVDFDAEELEDAKWFDKAFVAQKIAGQGDSDEPPLPGDFHVPSRISLARTLFETWIAEESA
jgi:NAD+ diphosphatase